MKIVEGNTQVLVKVLDMLKDVLSAMEAQGHKSVRPHSQAASLLLSLLIAITTGCLSVS